MNSSRAMTMRDRPPRQQLEVPADDHPGDDEQPVDDRVKERAEAAVLTGEARGEAVEVVGPADHGEQDDGERVLPVVAAERDDQEHRDQREPDEADRVRDRPRVERLIGSRLRAAADPSDRSRRAASW